MKPKLDPRGIREVENAELDDIAKRHGQNPSSPEGQSWINEKLRPELFGISLSGGGIRSATFALGVLQGLAELDLVPRAHYLSTVSGGGYIGSWLQGVVSRAAPGTNPYKALTRVVPGSPTDDPISFLRKYSDYLSPHAGLSIDAVVVPVIWLRNTLLNQAILITAFLAGFLVLLPLPALAHYVARSGSDCPVRIALVATVIFAAVAVFFVGYNLSKIGQRQDREDVEPAFSPGEGTKWIGLLVIAPLLFAVLSLVLSIFPENDILDSTNGRKLAFVTLWVLLALLQWGGGFIDYYIKQRNEIRKNNQERQKTNEATDEQNGNSKSRPGTVWSWLVPSLHVFWMSLATTAFIFLLFSQLNKLIEIWNRSGAAGAGNAMTVGDVNAIAWGPPLYMAALMAGITLLIGLMGLDFPEASREWLARVGAFLWVVAFGWAAIFAIVLFAPYGIARLWVCHGPTVISAIVVWVGTTISSVLAGKSGRSGVADKSKPGSSVTLDLVARYGPFVAAPAFLIALAFGLQLLLRSNLHAETRDVLSNFVGHYWETLPYAAESWRYPAMLFAALSAVFVLLSVRVNINEFSLHHFYESRLVRCFLGASAANVRKPDSFTGFDPEDDILLNDLKYDENKFNPAPYPILNATLTVTTGSELATQERKALPWIFTPLYSGFVPGQSAANKALQESSKPKAAPNGYVATSEIMAGQMRLGTAMAISGAAINPSDGYHSAPQTAFLMTLFDARLGWWIGNPRNRNTYRRTGPRFALWCLLRELFGFVDDRSAYLNLSDGGNFENLGLYELVRRRCRYVIVVDAEQDAKYVFESLGGAVRKCREDLGVEIDIDPRPIVPRDGLSPSHCVIGRIYYPPEEPKEQGERGWILYLKTSITGDEPADVEEYRREHEGFPQQSTTEQFFLESQFESYRRLGQHIARTTFDGLDSFLTVKEMFKRLKNRWDVPPKAPEGGFERQAVEYMRLMERLSGSPDLNFLDGEILEKFPSTSLAPERSAAFFRVELLQFMENVFFDLGLASSHAWHHPANAGWKRVFQFWAEQKTMKDFWESQKMNYSKPFQNFFDDLTNKRPAPSPERRI